MTRYSESYKNINEKTIEAVKALPKLRFFQMKWKGKFRMLRVLLNCLNHFYGTDIKLKRTDRDTNGYFQIDKNMIYLRKPSLVTFLHEYKHGLQNARDKESTEEVARGWSLSLFKKALPRHYKRAVRKGILFYK